MDNLKGYDDAVEIPDQNLKSTTRLFLITVGDSGVLYGKATERQAIVASGGNDPLGG